MVTKVNTPGNDSGDSATRSVATHAEDDIYVVMEFCKKLNYHMNKLGLSQAAVAKGVGYSPSLVGKWVRGKARPDIHQGLALARVLGVSLEYLADPDLPCMGADEVDGEMLLRRMVREVGARRLTEIFFEAMRRPATGGPVEAPPIVSTQFEDPRSAKPPARKGDGVR